MDSSHHAYFYTHCPQSFSEIARIAQTQIWSPITWNGKRLKENFLSAHMVALDFDEGFCLDEATGWLNSTKYKAFIALSKSHQKHKILGSGKILDACDRFRMVIMAAAPITDLHQYEENLKHWRTLLPADASCHDGARFFYNSPGLWHIQDGETFVWHDYSSRILDAKKRTEQRCERYRNHYEQVGAIPERIREIITTGSAVGSRHKTCYWLGATFAEMGIDEATTVRMIMSGPLGDIGLEEVEEAVSYGRRKAIGGSK